MFRQRRVTFFRKITSKMANTSKHSTGEKGRSSGGQTNQGTRKEIDHPILGRLEKGLLLQKTKVEFKGKCPTLKTKAGVPVQEPKTEVDNSNPKSKNSSLLAAKLQCDEWGVQKPKNRIITAPKEIMIPPKVAGSCMSSATPTSKTLNIRICKSQHPSFKPAQRHRSMKERREAKHKAQKFRCFQSTLFKIEEVDEKGVD